MFSLQITYQADRMARSFPSATHLTYLFHSDRWSTNWANSMLSTSSIWHLRHCSQLLCIFTKLAN